MEKDFLYNQFLYETIKKYNNGEMSDKERTAFDQALKSDPLLQEAFQGYSYYEFDLSDTLSEIQNDFEQQLSEQEMNQQQCKIIPIDTRAGKTVLQDRKISAYRKFAWLGAAAIIGWVFVGLLIPNKHKVSTASLAIESPKNTLNVIVSTGKKNKTFTRTEPEPVLVINRPLKRKRAFQNLKQANHSIPNVSQNDGLIMVSFRELPENNLVTTPESIYKIGLKLSDQCLTLQSPPSNYIEQSSNPYFILPGKTSIGISFSDTTFLKLRDKQILIPNRYTMVAAPAEYLDMGALHGVNINNRDWIIIQDTLH